MSALAVDVSGIWHSFGDTPVLRGVDLQVEDGEFVTLLGPSGSGKTTLLRIMGGLVAPERGSVVIHGTDMTRLPAQKRGIGFVFQNYALFPHMTVHDNVAFPLKVRKVNSETREEMIAKALDLVELGALPDRMPGQLSGGQQQRVALARALVFEPRVVLMDEPLGSLDKRLREQLQDSIRVLQRRLGFTAIYVTHDQSEAFSLSDRIAVMRDGEILQVGRPDQVYQGPIGPFVANFVGDLNRFHGTTVGIDGVTHLRCAGGLDLRLPPACSVPSDGCDVTLGVRPESTKLSHAPTELCHLPGVVRISSFQGSHYRVIVDLDSGTTVEVEYRETSDPGRVNDPVWIGWSPADALVFLRESG